MSKKMDGPGPTVTESTTPTDIEQSPTFQMNVGGRVSVNGAILQGLAVSPKTRLVGDVNLLIIERGIERRQWLTAGDSIIAGGEVVTIVDIPGPRQVSVRLTHKDHESNDAPVVGDAGKRIDAILSTPEAPAVAGKDSSAVSTVGSE